MQLGISVSSSYPVADPREGARFMLERTRAARAANFDSLFVGDHHVMASPYYQNVPMIGRLLADWGDEMAGALFLLPLWNPVLLAEQVATLASIHTGKFVMQCGLGRDQEQFDGMGVDIRYRPSAFEECLTAVRALWRGETVTLGPRYRNRGGRISPLPPETIDVWIGASAPAAIERAARLGDAWLGDPGMTLVQATERIAMYRESCARVGRRPATVPLRRDVYVGADHESARNDMARYLQGNYRGFDPQALIVGSVESVAEQLARYADVGFDHVLVRNISADQGQALATIERLGRVRESLRGV